VLSGFMVLKQVAPAASRRDPALCVPDAGASSLLTLTLSFRKERGSTAAELQDFPVKTILRIMSMLAPCEPIR